MERKKSRLKDHYVEKTSSRPWKAGKWHVYLKSPPQAVNIVIMMIVKMRWKAIVGAALQRATITMEKVMPKRAIGTSHFVCVSTPYLFTFLILLPNFFCIVIVTLRDRMTQVVMTKKREKKTRIIFWSQMGGRGPSSKALILTPHRILGSNKTLKFCTEKTKS